MSISVSAEGLDELYRDTDPQRLLNAVGKFLGDVVEIAAVESARRTPVATGTLQSAWGSQRQGLSAVLFIASRQNPMGGNTTEYGPIIDERDGISQAAVEYAMRRAAVKGVDWNG